MICVDVCKRLSLAQIENHFWLRGEPETRSVDSGCVNDAPPPLIHLGGMLFDSATAAAAAATAGGTAQTEEYKNITELVKNL